MSLLSHNALQVGAIITMTQIAELSRGAAGHLFTQLPRGGLPLFTNCLEEVFSETELPVYGVLGNLEDRRA
jgi:hypothetical protein